MVDVSDLKRDALLEIFNIGVGRAASSLSMIVGDEVLLSAPSLCLCSPNEAVLALSGKPLTKFSTVSQQFSGPFEAQAMLVFPEANALEIVGLMMGGTNLSAEELSEYEQEAMCEIGNIILNSSMSVLADMFEVQFDSTLPVHRFGDSQAALVLEGDPEQVVLLLQVDLKISQKCIHGQIVFLLSVSSLSTLLELVEAYLARMGLT
jgi:chemotaxis protein CheC